jgi:hypothetical protein
MISSTIHPPTEEIALTVEWTTENPAVPRAALPGFSIFFVWRLLLSVGLSNADARERQPAR